MKNHITYSNGNGHSLKNGNGHHYKSPAEIEREIDATKLRMEQTIQAIKNDLSPGQIVDQALHYFKDGKVGDMAGSVATSVGRFASNSATSFGGVVRANPLPAAVVGAGLVWLAANSYRNKHPKVYGVGPTERGELPEGFGESASLGSFNAGSEYGLSSESLDTTSFETTTYETEGHEGRMAGAKAKLGGVASSVKGRAGAMKAKASNIGHGVGTRARTMSHGAADKARVAKERTVVGARKAKDFSVNTYETNPLIIGAAAIGVGALLGALIPISSRENQMLGRKRDDLMKKADELGAKTLERAKGVVDQGVQKVKAGMDKSVGIVEGQQSGGATTSSFESSMAPTTGGMSGSTAYGTSITNPMVESQTTVISTTTQAAPLEGGSVEGSGSQSDLSREREVGGSDDKERGPGF